MAALHVVILITLYFFSEQSEIFEKHFIFHCGIKIYAHLRTSSHASGLFFKRTLLIFIAQVSGGEAH